MNIINAIQTRALINQGNVVLVDARGGADAFERYQKMHLQGALFVDLESDLSQKSENAANGGRHPLPEPVIFGELLGELGITPEVVVIIYDDKNGANAAARFWWMLKSAGHEKAYVVSGGLTALEQAGLPVNGELATPNSAQCYPVSSWNWPVAEMKLVANSSLEPDFVVIDVRENFRYKGESEPIDLVAGHIPGAINIPYTSNLTETGEFLAPEKLAEMYRAALADRDISKVIVHCGSGVTACHTLLALSEAGLEGASLYVGSWSEWSRNENPVAVGSN